jgi:hypothetical protein
VLGIQNIAAARRLLSLLAALVASLAVSAAPAGAVEPGVVQSANYDAANEAALTSGMGAKWVRLFHLYSKGCPNVQLTQRVDAYHAKGVKVLVVVLGSAQGDLTPPATAAEYAAFVGCMAAQYKGKVAAWEIWNEPDEKTFWTNGPEPARYAELLKESYKTIKAADPAATVVTGGMVGNNFGFLEKLYAAGAKGSFDAVGVHTDTACLVREPEFYYREPDGRIGRFAFTGYREVHAVMVANSDPKPIWMTEIGWSTLTSKCAHPGVTEDRPSGVSPTTQADYLKRAFACVANDPYVEKVLWFSMRDAGTGNQYDQHLGLQDFSGTPKPAYHAFSSLFAGGAQPAANPNCGGKLDTDAPQVTAKIPARYFSRLVIEGSATDATTGVHHMELWVDGKRVEGVNQDGGQYKLDWFGSTKLAYGKHTVELRAYDEALNVGKATVEVVRSNGSGGERIASARVSFKARKANRKIHVDARILRAVTGDFTEKPRGRMQIFFERKVGKKWKRYSRYTKGIAKRIKLPYSPKKPGTWRVWGRTALDAPYKNVRTKYLVFKL